VCREQNKLPDWISHSTVSGEMSVAGAKEKNHASRTRFQDPGIDVKPEVKRDASAVDGVYYKLRLRDGETDCEGDTAANEFESWYRSQNASSVATPLSTTSPATPGLLGSGGASDSSDDADEQDALETVAVNGNGKRAHGGGVELSAVKRVKSEDAVDGLIGDIVTVKGTCGDASIASVADDVRCKSVGGKDVPLAEVTDDMAELMVSEGESMLVRFSTMLIEGCDSHRKSMKRTLTP
jgi:hypothetical protein